MAVKEDVITISKPSPKEFRNMQEALDVVVATAREQEISKRQVWKLLKSSVTSVIRGYDPETGECSRLSWRAAKEAIHVWRRMSLGKKAVPLTIEQLWNIGCILETASPSDAEPGTAPAVELKPVKAAKAKPKAKPAPKPKAKPKAKPKKDAFAAAEAKMAELGGGK